MADRLPRLAVLRATRHRELAARARAAGARRPSRRRTATTSTPNAARWSRELGDGRLARSCASADGDVHAARRPQPRHRPRDARPPLRPRRFRLRHAGARLGRDQPVRHRRAEAPNGCPRSPRGEAIAAFAMTEPDCGSDAANIATTAPRATATAGSLDGEKTYISNGGIADFYVTLRPHRRRRRRARAVRLHRPRRRAGLTVAERIEVIAPAPARAAQTTTMRLPADACIGDAGRGLPHRHGDAQPVPRHRRRRRARLRPPRARRGDRLRDRRRKLGERHARRQCRHPGQARRHGDSRSMPRRCSSTAPPGSRTTARADNRRAAAMAKLHATESAQTGHRRGGAAARRRSASPRASRSKSSTATSARCASTKARAKCSARSSPATC